MVGRLNCFSIEEPDSGSKILLTPKEFEMFFYSMCKEMFNLKHLN